MEKLIGFIFLSTCLFITAYSIFIISNAYTIINTMLQGIIH